VIPASTAWLDRVLFAVWLEDLDTEAEMLTVTEVSGDAAVVVGASLRADPSTAGRRTLGPGRVFAVTGVLEAVVSYCLRATT
jgi:hypothetical protein